MIEKTKAKGVVCSHSANNLKGNDKTKTVSPYLQYYLDKQLSVIGDSDSV